MTKAKTLRKLVDDVAVELQKHVRLKAADSNGYVQCVTCPKKKHWKEMDGGHYISRSKTITAFSRLNVWAQCKHCNRHLSGNPIGYRKGLIDRVGIESVEFLEEVQKEKLELTKWNYAVRREYYRSCIKRLGI